MKTFVVWVFVIATSFLDIAHGATRTPEVAVRSSRTLRQQVDSYAELLQKELATAKNNKDKFRALDHSLAQIRVLRENTAPQGAVDESHMDLMVSILESLPKERQFKKKECGVYENDLVTNYEPTLEDEPKEPAVKPAWDFLKSVCN